MGLRDKVKELTNSLPIMEGREKGDMENLIGAVVTIRDYGFMEDGDKEYACFITDEDKEHFYFGGQVLTDDLRELEADGYHADVVKEGLPVMFGKKQSKTKNTQGRYNTYTTVQFYPEAPTKSAGKAK